MFHPARSSLIATKKLAEDLSKKFFEVKMEDERIDYQDAVELFDALYVEYPIAYGKAVSRQERESFEYHSTTLVYGEINFLPFARHFRKIYKYGFPEDGGGVFVDIGCGTGKPVFAAALLHDFDCCIGIEILENLTGVCAKVLNNWKRVVRHKCSRSKFNIDIRFIHGDATCIDWWTDADVVFANSTCFDDELMLKLADRANQLKPGAFFITTTKRLPSEQFRLLETAKMSETWGQATVFIQKREDIEGGADAVATTR